MSLTRTDYPGRDATLQGVDDDGCLYAVVGGRVRTAINSIHGELMGTGTTGPVPQEPAAASAMNRGESANPRAETKNESPAKERNAASTQEEMPLTKPVRGVVLEFATRMRQSRGREALLND